MKKIKFISAGLLLASFLFSIPVQGSDGVQYSVLLGEKAGVLKKTDSALSFQPSALFVQEEDGKKRILDPFGDDGFGKAFDKVEGYGEGTDFLTVTEYEAMPNDLSLVKSDGTVLVDHAAIIRVMGNGTNRRYAEVTFATDEVFDEEDCFLFSYKPEAMIDIQLTPGQGDTMYAGYTRVFDMQEEQFVENVLVENVGDRVEIVGENILVDHYPAEEEDELYRPDGSLVGTVDASTVKKGNCFVSKTQDGKYFVRDENLMELARLEFQPQSVYADGTLFTKNDDRPYQIVDADGTAISSLAFASSPAQKADFLVGADSENHYAVLKMDGSTILDFQAKASTVMEIAYGILSITYEDGNYGILYPDGRLGALKNRLGSNLLAYTNGESNKCEAIWILNQAEYVKASDLGLDGWIEEAGPMMFEFRNEDGHGLYSIADGKELLSPEDGYKNFSYSGGYIYGEKEDSWDIFPCTISGIESED